jgi:hydrogenase maturation protein HypF
VSVAVVRSQVRVEGTIQGVGFRPYVYRLAHELALGGYVRNDSSGVLLEVEGSSAAVEAFLARLAPEAPPLAEIERIAVHDREPTGESRFQIVQSPRGGEPNAPVAPDTATCDDCLRELLDPGDRRFRYAFINCTSCGPRFTIVQGVPYDRPLTTMARFRMCESCQAEYEDPADRRFHAQPNACPRCGPSLSLRDRRGAELPPPGDADAVRAAADALLCGSIVALKGIGGFHLACRADDESVVAALRGRKHREDKPFALMAPTLEVACTLTEVGEAERRLLLSPARPIVLSPRLEGAPVARSVAPGLPELGVMLPYSPLHHLLMADVGRTLVMTSGNVSDEPIAYRDDDALERLAGIADLFLLHDRPIQTRTDDSVVRAAAVLRRSRGYVPSSIPLPGAGTPRPLVACGAELKSTFCAAKGRRAWVSHHIGDLENYETLRSFTEGIEHFERLFAVVPEVVVHDLHPEYLSTKYALERDGVELVGVQHHHAHLAACLAEHDVLDNAVGAIFDGTGYGTDGTMWGGELLYGDLRDFERVGGLRSVTLPGGAQAVRQPWRMAASWLVAIDGPGPELPARLVGRISPADWAQVCRLAHSGVSSPLSTGMGRLFDTVAALCGLRGQINYEGQAAIELEACCDRSERGRYPITLAVRGGMLVIDPAETIRAIAADLARGEPVGRIASRFHAAIAQVTVEACSRAASERGTETVVLSGGVFANRRLIEQATAGLAAAGLRILTPRRLPANDGGIAYGQAAVAAARLGGL